MDGASVVPGFLAGLDWAAIAQIVLIDILLGGDNAIVIALACRRLPPDKRFRGIVWGTAGAIVLRVVMIFFALELLDLALVKLVGGALLLWIGVQLLIPERDRHEGIDGGTTLLSAIRTVVFADLLMSIDNVIGVAGAAAQAAPDHRLGLVIFGLLVSIPLIIWGSSLVIRLIERHAVVIWLGGALLGWIAGTMITGDPVVRPWLDPVTPVLRYGCALAGALFVVGCGWWSSRRRLGTRVR